MKERKNVRTCHEPRQDMTKKKTRFPYQLLAGNFVYYSLPEGVLFCAKERHKQMPMSRRMKIEGEFRSEQNIIYKEVIIEH
jgi:hypothetical protein